MSLFARGLCSSSASTGRFRQQSCGMVRLVAGFALALLLCLGAGVASAATYTVNSTADTGAGSGTSGDLRYAITQANANSGSTITFSVTGTITLTSALPPITANTTIQGPGANRLTVSGDGKYPVLVTYASLDISGLTIAHGSGSCGSISAGGGVCSISGSLIVSNTNFSDNFSTAEGGAIYFQGTTLTVTGSTFSNNSTDVDGGAITTNSGSSSPVTIANDTFFGNSAQNGGAIFSAGTPTTVTNSTFSGNSVSNAGGAIVLYSGTLTANNNIFTDNKAANGAAMLQNPGSTLNASYNVYHNNLVSGTEADCTYCTGNTNTISGDPKLLALGFYGGTTETFLPQPGSSAICAGNSADAVDANNNQLTTDQRGFSLSTANCANSGVDAGAVQSAYQQVTSTNDSGAGSLRAAVINANTAGRGDISFASGLNGQSINLTSGTLSLTGISGINIIGPGANLLTINGGGSGNNFSVYTVNAGVTATLYGLTIAKGYLSSSSFGGGINNAGTLSLLESVLTQNSAGFGSALFNSGTVSVGDSTIANNTATNRAAVYNSSGTMTLTESTVSGNTGSTVGGISNFANLTLNATTVSGNIATAGGSFAAGGLDNSNVGAPISASNSIIEGNSAPNGSPSVPDASIYTGEFSDNGGNLMNESSTPVDPHLSPLQLNGIGSTVQTMIPLPGSPAICAGKTANIPLGTTTDERGYPLSTPSYCTAGQIDSGAVQTNYTSIAFVQQPSNTFVSTAISPAPAVEVVETDSSTTATDTVAGVPVTLDYSGGAAELSGGVGSLTATSGAATIGGNAVNAAVFNLAPTTEGSGFTLALGQGGAGISVGSATFSQTSNSFQVYGPAVQLVVSAPATATAGTPFNVDLIAEDGAGDQVPGYSPLIVVNAPGGSYSGAGALNNGSATIPEIYFAAGTYQISANTLIVIPQLSGSSGTITVGPAAPASVAVSGYPSTVYAGASATGTVEILDAYGNLETGYSGTVDLTTSENPVAVPVTITNGIGTFSLSFASAATNQSITASISPLTSVSETGITVNPPPNYVVETPVDDASGVASNCPAGGGGTTCTLRDALTAASTAGVGKITFDATVFATAQTILLNSTLPRITEDVTITGPGTSLLTVSGNYASTIFDIRGGTSVISGMTIANGYNAGYNGGAIYNVAGLTLSSCVITGSQETGNGSGGAIFNAHGASLTIRNCTISNNAANAYGALGGGLDNWGAATITASTFSGNTATGGSGGAIYNSGVATLTLTDSTLTQNQAIDNGPNGTRGGAILNSGTLLIQNSTIAGNAQVTLSGTGDYGGGLVTGPNCTLSNTVLAGNTDVGGYPDIHGTCSDGGNNLIGNGTGLAGITNGVNGDMVGTAGSPINPGLSAPGNYGGPTQTMIPLPGSPAICAGSASLASSASITADQRGVPLSAGGYCTPGSVDAGAVQSDYALTFSTEPGATQYSGAAFPVAVTLSEDGSPFTAASETIPLALTGGSVTSFAGNSAATATAAPNAGVASYSLTLTNATAVSGLQLGASLTLNGSAAAKATSNSFDLAEPVPTSLTPTVTPNTSFTYSNQPTISVAVTPAAATGTLTATLDGSTALAVTPGAGGSFSIALPATPLAVGNHTIALAFTGTGAYESSTGSISLTVTAPSLVVNNAGDSGAGASDCTYNSTGSGAGSCTLRDALAAAATAGGGNITFDSTMFSASNTAAQNTITLTGGSTLNIPSNTTIQGATSGSGAALTNLVTVAGGGSSSNFSIITVGSGVTATIKNLQLTNGNTSASGGAINNSGTLTVTNSTISGNSVTNAGCGGAINNSGALTLVTSTIARNTVSGTSGWGGCGGAGIASSGSALQVIDSTISGNTVSGSNVGGGILFNSGALTITNSTISGNFATAGSGGGIYLASGTTTVTNSTIAGNSATSYADIYINSGSTYNDGGGNLASTNSSGTSTIAPQLAPLGSYGGPTQTMIPLPGSAAICAGSASLATSASITTDQRGAALKAAGYCAPGSVDAGAVQTDYAIKFVQQPSTVVQNIAMAPAPTVELDENGAPFADGTDTVTIPLTLTTGSGAVTGGSAATSATTGIAAYSSLSVTLPGTGDQLTANLALNPAITPNSPTISVASGNFNVDSAVTQLAFSTAPPATVTAGGNAGASIVVHEEDVSGALVTTAGDTITLTVTGPNSYAQTYTATAASGAATFNLSSAALTLGGGYTYTASIATAPSVTNAVANETVQAAAAASVAVFSGSGQSTVIGSTFGASLKVLVEDQFGNTVQGATVVFTAPASGASATFTVPAVTAADGTTSVTATANGLAGAYAVTAGVAGGATSGSFSLTNTKHSTTLTVTPSSTALVYGQPVTVNAAISPASVLTTTPTGAMTFYDGAATLTPVTGVASSGASFAIAVPAVGSHTYAAQYAGDANFLQSAQTSAASALVVGKASSTLSGPTATVNLTYGTGGTIPIAIAGQFSGTGIATPSGTLTYTIGTGAPQTAAIASGAATLVIPSTQAAANYTIAVNYSGDGNYNAATAINVNLSIGPATLTVIANNASKIYGTTNPAFTGTVTGQQGSDSFTESFATTATQSSPVGTYAIVPSVTGTNLADYTQAITNGALKVTQASSITTLRASSATITPGQNVLFTATVKSATTGTPTGTVTFFDGSLLLGTSTLNAGAATMTTNTLAPGLTHTITATYAGDANFTGSATSGTVAAVVTVAPLDFTFNLASPVNLTVVPGQSISYQIKVTPDYGSYAGTVNFAMTGLPAGATATFSPASIPANGGPQTVTVTIQTAPAVAALGSHDQPSTPGRKAAPFALAFLVLFGVGGLRKRGRKLRGLLCVLVLAGAGLLAMGVSGCAGHPGFFAQSQQNYSVTVTATSANLQHSATINLNVQ